MSNRSQLLVVSHRGAKGLAKENTSESVKKAMEYPVSAIETDVRVTKDNHVVLHHDKVVNLRSGTNKNLSAMTLAELQEEYPDVMTLNELVEQTVGHARLMLDIKREIDIEPVITELSDALKKGVKQTDLAFASFDLNALTRLKKAFPKADFIVIEPWSSVRARHKAKKLATNYLSMNQKFLWSGFIRAISRRYKLYAYTLNDADKARAWENYGLYGVITDSPDYFLAHKGPDAK